MPLGIYFDIYHRGDNCMKITTIFKNGRSQAVRLPKEFRFEGERVIIEKDGECVILRPFDKKWSEQFWSIFGALSPDFERPASRNQNRERAFE